MRRQNPDAKAGAVLTGEVETQRTAPGVETLSTDDARAITDQIKQAVADLWELIVRAYRERAWAVLDYDSWDEYCRREFATLPSRRVSPEERADIVAGLREAGLSIRAIASATGHSVTTVQSDIQVYQTDTPDVDESPPTITGTDGKYYPAKREPNPAPSSKPTRRSFKTDIDYARSQMVHCASRISRWAGVIDELRGDDRYPKYRNDFEDRIGRAVVELVWWSWPNLTQEQRDRIADLFADTQSAREDGA
jgi:transposase-like protein